MRDQRPTFKHRLEYAALYLVFLMGRFVPRKGFVRLGAWVGRISFDWIRVRRDITLNNLRRAFGDEMTEDEITNLGRKSYEALGRALLEFCSLWNMNSDEVDAAVDVEGLEIIREAVKEKGCMLVTGHYGSWELFGAAISVKGVPVTYLVKDLKNPYVARIQDRLRERGGIQYVKDGPVVARGVMRAIRDKRLVGILPDQDARRHGVFVDFLGTPASTYRGPAFFAYRNNVPIIAAFIRRLPSGDHRAKVFPPIYPDPSRPEEEEIHRLTQAYTDIMSEWIRAYPEEYFWVHRRWKSKPEDFA